MTRTIPSVQRERAFVKTSERKREQGEEEQGEIRVRGASLGELAPICVVQGWEKGGEKKGVDKKTRKVAHWASPLADMQWTVPAPHGHLRQRRSPPPSWSYSAQENMYPSSVNGSRPKC